MPRRTHLIEILRDPADPTQFLYRHSDDVVGFRADLKKSDAFKINSGESVQWTSSLGNFAIIFESTTPFHGNAVAFGAAKGGFTSKRAGRPLRTATSIGTVRADFTYTFAAFEDTASGFVPVIDDPLMELEDSGGGTE